MAILDKPADPVPLKHNSSKLSIPDRFVSASNEDIADGSASIKTSQQVCTFPA